MKRLHRGIGTTLQARAAFVDHRIPVSAECGPVAGHSNLSHLRRGISKQLGIALTGSSLPTHLRWVSWVCGIAADGAVGVNPSLATFLSHQAVERSVP